MKPHYLAHIIYILESIELLEEEAAKGKLRLLEDKIVYRGVLYSLQTLGESTGKLPEDIKTAHPHIPWRKILGLRNILVHDYLGDFDVEGVWNVIVKELPILKQALNSQFPELDAVRRKLKE